MLQLGKSVVSNFQQPMLLPVTGRWCKHISSFSLALPCVLFTTKHWYILWLRVGFLETWFM
jgi:hypothetical protein